MTELQRRDYRHASPLDETLATGDEVQSHLIDTVEDQIRILRSKGCDCNV